jgi:hypothetical protein
MSGRQSRDKGARTERAMVRLLQTQGIAKADRQEPLVVLRMSLAAEIAKRTV